MLALGALLLAVITIRGIWRGYQRKRIDQLLHTRQGDYDGLLTRYNPYYKSLSSEGRNRFLERVLQFIESKRFEYIDLEADERIPLLIRLALPSIPISRKIRMMISLWVARLLRIAITNPDIRTSIC